MSINVQSLFKAYDELSQFIGKNHNWEEGFAALKIMFDEKKHKPDANIMMYGVYNAGKSTVINALVGKEVAEVGDIPLTHSVSEYQCGHFAIWDTPGIDAPKEHEQVTNTQLLKADAIIFVVNPLGVVEEEKTLSILMDLFAKDKKVFLLFNTKHDLSDEDFILLKDQTRKQLQQLATQRGLDGVLKNIPILKMNAKFALQAKVSNDADFLEYSGYTEFEQTLHDFLSSITPEETYGRLKNALLIFIQKILEDLNAQSQSELVKQYDNLIYLASSEKIAVRKKMLGSIDKSQSELYRSVNSWLKNDQTADNLQNLLNQWVDTKSKSLESELSLCFEETYHHIQMGIEQLEAILPTMKVQAITAGDFTIEPGTDREQNNVSSFSKKSFTFDPVQAEMAKVFIKQNVTPETVLATLKVVKNYLPSLMKGIGTKTMEKWAAMVSSKAVPFLGVAISVGMGLHDAFSEDEETKALRQQQEQMALARERREQQIDEIATQISNQIKVGFSNAASASIDEFFNGLLMKLKEIKGEFSEQDQLNSRLIDQLLQVKRQAVYE